ncbi:MAG: hypothetical protein ACYDAJ_05865 [Nitrosotalea sp.]
MRVFYTQKLDNLLGTIDLTDWRWSLLTPLHVQNILYLIIGSPNALGERLKKEGRDFDKVEDLTPEATNLGFDFATSVKRRYGSTALEILEQIERLPTTWRNP